MILSAKYGFIDQEFIIPANYNVTFKKESSKPITIDVLRRQVKEKDLENYEIVIALGGEDYSSKVRRVFSGRTKVIAPANGLRLGIGMNRINSLLNLSKEQMLKRIMQTDE